MLPSARRAARTLAAALLVLLAAAEGAAEGNGVLGLFFDANASACSGRIAPGGLATLYVLLAPDGDTRGGISGAEFRVTTAATGYRLFAEEALLPNLIVKLGEALGAGTNVAANGCPSGLVIPILRFQVQNLSGGNDAVVGIDAKNPPQNPDFPCALVTLCDLPAYTKVCIRPGKAVLNPTGSVACGSGAASAEWGGVKELYR